MTVKSMEWLFNNMPLYDDGDNYTISSHDNHTSILTVTNVEVNDFGAYNCVVTDNLHVTISVIGYLNHTGEYVIIILPLCHY